MRATIVAECGLLGLHRSQATRSRTRIIPSRQPLFQFRFGLGQLTRAPPPLSLAFSPALLPPAPPAAATRRTVRNSAARAASSAFQPVPLFGQRLRRQSARPESGPASATRYASKVGQHLIAVLRRQRLAANRACRAHRPPPPSSLSLLFDRLSLGLQALHLGSEHRTHVRRVSRVSANTRHAGPAAPPCARGWPVPPPAVCGLLLANATFCSSLTPPVDQPPLIHLQRIPAARSTGLDYAGPTSPAASIWRQKSGIVGRLLAASLLQPRQPASMASAFREDTLEPLRVVAAPHGAARATPPGHAQHAPAGYAGRPTAAPAREAPGRAQRGSACSASASTQYIHGPAHRLAPLLKCAFHIRPAVPHAWSMPPISPCTRMARSLRVRTSSLACSS